MVASRRRHTRVAASAIALSSVVVAACEQPREIEITWHNDTGRTVAYYPVRRGLEELTDVVGAIKVNVYEPDDSWQRNLDVGDGEAPWCPRGDVPYDYYFVEPLPSTPIVDGQIDDSRVSIDDLTVLAVIAVDRSFCFPDRTGNDFSVTADP